MKTYNVTFFHGWNLLADFAVYAKNITEARRKAQTEKRLYCQYDKPDSIPANRIKVTTRFAWNNPEYNY